MTRVAGGEGFRFTEHFAEMDVETSRGRGSSARLAYGGVDEETMAECGIAGSRRRSSHWPHARAFLDQALALQRHDAGEMCVVDRGPGLWCFSP